MNAETASKERSLVIVVMGVVGAGKSTVGTRLAEKLGWQFADADNFHSPENKNKISHGIALTDADRAPWLAALRHAIEQWNREGQNVVLACSALKRAYRFELQTGNVQFVYLKGDYEVIAARLRTRHGHFATDSILKSQLADLEEPSDAIVVSIDKPPDRIVGEILEQLKTAYPDAILK
jgi:gluconokinase